MKKYIIRLDDACPFMKKENWDRMEQLLDKYNIKPIVGIIPDCKDIEFNYSNIDDFWVKYAKTWQDKNWIIALHGLHHDLNDKVRTEFSNKSYDEQKKVLSKGNKILVDHNINPTCFFAPNHTFDLNTIKALNDLKIVNFISDGYAIYPYNYKDMLFFPSVFDTPHNILPFGIWTFVYHPNNMNEHDFQYLENFIIKNRKNFNVDLEEIIKKYKNRKRNLFDIFIEKMIFLFRKVRKYEK